MQVMGEVRLSCAEKVTVGSEPCGYLGKDHSSKGNGKVKSPGVKASSGESSVLDCSGEEGEGKVTCVRLKVGI